MQAMLSCLLLLALVSSSTIQGPNLHGTRHLVMLLRVRGGGAYNVGGTAAGENRGDDAARQREEDVHDYVTEHVQVIPSCLVFL